LNGDIWYNSENGRTYTYYIDANTSQWVEFGNANEGPTGPQGNWSVSQTVNNKTASYTLLTADVGKLITMSVAGSNNLTVNGSLDLAVGQRIDLAQLGAGQTTVVASGATVNATPGLKFRAQYSAATLICTGTDTYLLVGDLSA
jgi:hypothetical protein